MATQLTHGLLAKGKEFLEKAKEGDLEQALRQIFPFNPYIAYGPFLTIPLWVLMGMYIKLLSESSKHLPDASVKLLTLK
jgi:hypothetical protein